MPAVPRAVGLRRVSARRARPLPGEEPKAQARAARACVAVAAVARRVVARAAASDRRLGRIVEPARVRLCPFLRCGEPRLARRRRAARELHPRADPPRLDAASAALDAAGTHTALTR